MPGAFKAGGHARAGRRGGPGAGRTRRRGHATDVARPAAVVRRHCGELLCALGHFAHGPRQHPVNYRIIHRTLYDYTAPVTVSHHVARLEPRVTAVQERLSFEM